MRPVYTREQFALLVRLLQFSEVSPKA